MRTLQEDVANSSTKSGKPKSSTIGTACGQLTGKIFFKISVDDVPGRVYSLEDLDNF